MTSCRADLNSIPSSLPPYTLLDVCLQIRLLELFSHTFTHSIPSNPRRPLSFSALWGRTVVLLHGKTNVRDPPDWTKGKFPVKNVRTPGGARAALQVRESRRIDRQIILIPLLLPLLTSTIIFTEFVYIAESST